MKPVILYTLFGYMYIVSAKEACTTPTDLDGECVLIDDCDKLKPLIKENREYLKKWHCGYENHVPRVCCPVKVPKDRCDTFSGTKGSCVPITACPSIQKKLKKPVSSENLDYVYRSRCRTTESWHVCCDPSEILSGKLEDKTSGTDFAGSNCDPSALIPDRINKCCGIDSSTSNKIVGGTAAAIDAYPWLVIIEYSNNRPLLCGGSLISGRYVLTAAHCLTTGEKSLGAESVRLGEYNVANKGPDCVETDGGGEDCTKGDTSIKIESTIIHPQYTSLSGDKYNLNDIALIRLMEIAPYNEFIKPICLPVKDVTASPPSDLKFFIAGWGSTNETETSDVKLEATIAYVNQQTCNEKYSRNDKTILGSSQMCAGGDSKDTCRGDSGGPLSYSQDDIQDIVGVTSFGLAQCATVNRPSIYTKVYDYLPWIYSNIKP